jgi:hypothetical protein
MNADKDRATKKLLSFGLEPPDGDHKKHQETGAFSFAESAFICVYLRFSSSWLRLSRYPGKSFSTQRRKDGKTQSKGHG